MAAASWRLLQGFQTLKCFPLRVPGRRLSSSILRYGRQGSTGGNGRWAVVGALAGVGGAWVLSTVNWRSRDTPGGVLLLPSVSAEGGGKAGKGESAEEAPKISRRELRYQDFCSIKYEGELYMTARDFVESVTQDTPRGEGNGWRKLPLGRGGGFSLIPRHW